MTNPTELTTAHKKRISASNAYRMMTALDHDTLPSGARSYISDMFNLSPDDFAERYVSRAMQWGIDNEPAAIAALEDVFDVQIEYAGEHQERLYAGEDYFNFVSALPDGLMMFGELICTIETKCLNQENHDFAVNFIVDSETLKQYDFEKYCQVQTQNLCAEAYYNQPVKSLIAFYDPRHALSLHYIEVDADNNWRETFKERVMLAKQLYDSISTENPNAAVLYDNPMPPVKVVTAAHDMVITEDMIDSLLDNPEDFVKKAHDFFNVRVVNDHFIGGDLHFDCSTKKGRDEAIKFRTKVKKVRTTAIKISKELVNAYTKKVKQEQTFRKYIEIEMKALEDYLCQSLNEWEAEQARIEREAIEAKRREDEELRQREAKRIATLRDKINEIYPVNFDTLEEIEAEKNRIESIVIDALYQEYEKEAERVKTDSLASLANLAVKKKNAIIERHQNNLDALKDRYQTYDSTEWSVVGLEQKLAEAKQFNPQEVDFGKNLANAIAARDNIITHLENDLIPSLKAKEQALAEKRAAEIVEQRKQHDDMRQAKQLETNAKQIIAEEQKPANDEPTDIKQALLNALVKHGLLKSKLLSEAVATLNAQHPGRFDGYLAQIGLCQSLSDLASVMNDMPTEAKAKLKPLLEAQQHQIKQSA